MLTVSKNLFSYMSLSLQNKAWAMVLQGFCEDLKNMHVLNFPEGLESAYLLQLLHLVTHCCSRSTPTTGKDTAVLSPRKCHQALHSNIFPQDFCLGQSL